MREAVRLNRRYPIRRVAGKTGGFTLVEVMVSLMVLAFGLLASIVGISSALDYCLVNEMRNDAMKLAQQQVEAIRNMPYSNIQNISTSPQTITKQERKTLVNYTVTFSRPSTVLSGANVGMSMVQISVQWSFKKRTYPAYVLQTIVRQAK
jgi:prepilin-type N-terminal cleavage/methylation domain-containing protein